MRTGVKVWQLLVVVAVTFVLAAVGVAVATIPDENGVIHGCYKKSGNNKGMVRVIDTAVTSTCPTGFAPLNWNQQGIQGEPGVQGEPGLPGVAIAEQIRLASAPFVTGVQHTSVEATLSPSSWIQSAGTLNLLYGRVTATVDDPRCSGQVSVNVDFMLDGRTLGYNTLQLDVTNPSTRTADFGFARNYVNVPFTEVIFEGASSASHTIRAFARSSCAYTEFEEISIDVVEVG